jgi:predicted nucleotidyltransferase
MGKACRRDRARAAAKPETAETRDSWIAFEAIGKTLSPTVDPFERFSI